MQARGNSNARTKVPTCDDRSVARAAIATHSIAMIVAQLTSKRASPCVRGLTLLMDDGTTARALAWLLAGHMVLMLVIKVMCYRTDSRHRGTTFPLILGGTVSGTGDSKHRANTQEYSSQDGTQFRFQVEAHQIAHQHVVAGNVSSKSRVWHLEQSGHHQQ